MLTTSQQYITVVALAVAVIGFDVKMLQYPLIMAVTIIAYRWYTGADKASPAEDISEYSKPKKSKVEFVLKQKNPVKTGLSRVARERFELSTSGL